MNPPPADPAGPLAPHPALERYYGEEADRRAFLDRVFDETAPGYDRIIGFLSFGSGAWYRRFALRRAGLVPGMQMLDVAVGTGAVSRAALRLLGDPEALIGIDPSPGMLAQARRRLPIGLLRGVAERLPLRDETFDFLSMGYALRHVRDLRTTFDEYFRVLRPGGRLLVLDFARPRTRTGYALARLHFQRVLPAIARLGAGGEAARLLMRYCWETLERCVPPAAILEALRAAGFRETRSTFWFGVFSEYFGVKPPANGAD